MYPLCSADELSTELRTDCKWKKKFIFSLKVNNCLENTHKEKQIQRGRRRKEQSAMLMWGAQFTQLMSEKVYWWYTKWFHLERLWLVWMTVMTKPHIQSLCVLVSCLLAFSLNIASMRRQLKSLTCLQLQVQHIFGYNEIKHTWHLHCRLFATSSRCFLATHELGVLSWWARVSHLPM